MGLEGDFARLGDVQASGDSQRCLEWLHSLGIPKCHCQSLQAWGRGPSGLGAPVLPPSKQIYSDSFGTWAAAEPGWLCGALGCSGMIWGAGETSHSPMVPVGGGDVPQVNPTASVAGNAGGISTFDFPLMARVTLVPLIQ